MRYLQNQMIFKQITLIATLFALLPPTLQAEESTSTITTDGLTLTITDTLVYWSCGLKELEYVNIAIVVSDGSAEIWGFDLMLTFDSLGATLDSVSPGSAIERMKWDYSTHRIGPSPFPPENKNDNRVGLRIISAAITNHFYDTLTYDVSAGDTLAVLHFRLNHYRNYTSVETILRWVWVDCGDNLLSNVNGDSLYASDRVFGNRYHPPNPPEPQGPDITNYSGTFPTQGGMPDSCETLANSSDHRGLIRWVNFEAGGVVTWGGDCMDTRGDVDGVGWIYQPEDVQFLADLITKDSSNFDGWLDMNGWRVYKTDFNNNRIPFEVSDLTQLSRLMTHDDIPPSFLEHDKYEIAVHQTHEMVSVNREAGAVLLVFQGPARVTLLQEQMELRIGMRDGNTHALIYDISQSIDSVARIEPGELVRTSGNMISAEAAEYQGARLRTHFNQSQHNPAGVFVIPDQEDVFLGARTWTPIIYRGETIKARDLNLTVGYDSAHFPVFYATLGPNFDTDRTTLATNKVTLDEAQFPASGVNTALEMKFFARGENLNLSEGDTVAILQMWPSNDRNLVCETFPLLWVWRDCDDNAITANSRRYVSRDVVSNTYKKECSDDTLRNDITDIHGTLPGLAGLPESCRTQDLKRRPEHRTARTLDFYSGSIRIVCPVVIDTRGDCNLNGVSNEPEDIDCWVDILLGRCSSNPYFGGGCWDIYNEPYLSELQRIISPQPIPCPPVPPDKSVDTLTIRSDFVSASGYTMYITDRPFGSILLEFEGDGFSFVYNVVSLTKIERESETLNGKTRYLLHGDARFVFPAEHPISLSQPKLVAAYAATPDGRDMVVILDFATGVSDEVSPTLPERFALKQNYPNPYNPRTTISFDLPRKSAWELSVYNISGQIVQRFTGENSAGTASVNLESASWASGVYFYKLTAGEFTATRKMVLLK